MSMRFKARNPNWAPEASRDKITFTTCEELFAIPHVQRNYDVSIKHKHEGIRYSLGGVYMSPSVGMEHSQATLMFEYWDPKTKKDMFWGIGYIYADCREDVESLNMPEFMNPRIPGVTREGKTSIVIGEKIEIVEDNEVVLTAVPMREPELLWWKVIKKVFSF